MWPALKADARTQTEAAPDEHTEMRCRPANQSLITDVFRPRPLFCTIHPPEPPQMSRAGNDNLRLECLTGDIRDLRCSLAVARHLHRAGACLYQPQPVEGF